MELAKFLTLDNVDVRDKVVLLRVDFNSAIDLSTKRILEDARIRAHAETTIKELQTKGAKTAILAHQGRKGDPDFIPLQQHADILAKILKKPVKYIDDLFGEKAKRAIRNLKTGEIIVLENVRTFEAETKEGTPEQQAKTELVENLAPLANLFVNDAFAAAHRAHVSIIGFTPVLPSYAGRIMERELNSLSKVAENPEKPSVYILGGAKADDSLEISRYVLDNQKADNVLTGGVVGQVFLAAKGVNLGNANIDYLRKNQFTNLLSGIKELMMKYPDRIQTPTDVAVDIEGKRKELPISQLPTEYSIFDIGPKTVENYERIVWSAKSIVISGPMGVYENDEFRYGTKRVLEAIAKSKAFSLAGGGHTISALEKFGLSKKISYVSTAGGALIEFLMGKKLPGVIALEKAAARLA